MSLLPNITYGWSKFKIMKHNIVKIQEYKDNERNTKKKYNN